MTGRPCLCCTSGSHERIDVELAAGTPITHIAKRYKVGVDSLKRHKRNHLSPAFTKVALERLREDSAHGAYEATLDRLEHLIDRLDGLLSVAEERKSLLGGANIAREIRQGLELAARLRGELDTRPQVNVVNLMASPEVSQLISVIASTLEPWPEARVAIADKLEAIDVEAEAS